MNTFGGFCIAACIFMIFVGMASGVVNTLGVFPSLPTMDASAAKGAYDINSVIWMGGTTIGAAVTLIAALLGASYMIGICIFGTIFWTSWLSIQNIFYTGGFLNNPTGISIVAMLWFGMTVMFIGAVVGILSPGSTSMR